MNPFSLALTAIRVITTLRPSTPVDEPAPAPKRGKKAVAPVPAVVKKNWKPALYGLATGVMVAAGLYAGNMDTSTALSYIAAVDFNGILAIFQ